MTLKIGVVGVKGRMGGLLVQQILKIEGLTLVGGTVRDFCAPEDIGAILGGASLGVQTCSYEDLCRQASVVIDFTKPEATIAALPCAVKEKTALVIGTTGLDKAQEEQLFQASQSVPIVYAANFSLGVNLLAALVEKAASLLDAEDYDIEIAEMHHRYKVDAPSGTALALGRAAAKGRGQELEQVQKLSREGVNGVRPAGEIGFATLRGGNVVGDHEVIFAAAEERIVLGHFADDRSLFAKGAVKAASWIKGKKPGLYTMKDVLGL